ncbi:hypothetical protein [Chamaesiphon sp. VAR_48_metabat_403]|uniref:hypothetical protein n=1 Tax=Chamaesiphon sp. VAR_48_metabat_403 TaxID=2964700 RepID=UPI00286E4EAE|nr:hypothetical protein [Chamaesiphon sp. VAR_48_metabat_403]
MECTRTNRLLELRPEAARFWIDRIKRIERDSIEATFDRLPEGWTSDMRLKFTIDLVVASRDRLIKLASERSSTTDEINKQVIDGECIAIDKYLGTHQIIKKTRKPWYLIYKDMPDPWIVLPIGILGSVVFSEALLILFRYLHRR